MTPFDKALAALKKINAAASGDTERDHVDADAVLCSLLCELGAGEVVDEWGKVPKWYA